MLDPVYWDWGLCGPAKGIWVNVVVAGHETLDRTNFQYPRSKDGGEFTETGFKIRKKSTENEENPHKPWKIFEHESRLKSFNSIYWNRESST